MKTLPLFSQIQVMLDKQCRNLGGIQSKQIPNREVYWNKWTPTGCLKGCVIVFHKLSREAVTITVLVIDISVLILLGKIRQRRASSLPLPGAQLLTPNEPKRRSAHPADCQQGAKKPCSLLCLVAVCLYRNAW